MSEVQILDAYGNAYKKNAYADQIPDYILNKRRYQVSFGLYPEKLNSILGNADNYEFQELVQLCDEILEKDSHYNSISKIKDLMITGLPVTVEALTDDAEDVYRAEECLALIESDAGVTLRKGMCHANRKAFSVQETVWGTVRTSRGVRQIQTDFLWVDPVAIRYKADAWEQMQLCVGPERYIDLDPENFFVTKRPLIGNMWWRGGSTRAASHIYLAKNTLVRDLLNFAEKFGTPWIIGYYAQGQKDVQAKMQEAFNNFGRNMAGAFPMGSEVQIGTLTGATNAELFLNAVEYCNKEYSKLELFQTMTTEDGSSLGQAKVHDKQQTLGIDGYGVKDASDIRKNLFAPYLRRNYGPDVTIPKVTMKTRVEEDLGSLMARFEAAHRMQVPVEHSFIRDKNAWPEPAAGADTIGKIVEVAGLAGIQKEVA